MGRECKSIDKTFKDASGKIINTTVKLFPWEELNYVDKVKSEFGI
jgi:S-adenosylmethionine synthetase